MTEIKTIGVLTYDRASEADTLIPFEIFTGVSLYLGAQNKERPEVTLLGLEAGDVTLQMGVTVKPKATLQETDLFDLLYIPGGMGSGDMGKNTKMLDTIRRHKAAGKVIASNCTGIGILQRAGILGQTPVTCSPPIIPQLRRENVNVVEPRLMWVGVPEDNLWTAIGASGIGPGTVALVHHYFGDDVGKEMSMWSDCRGIFGDRLFNTRGPECYLFQAAHDKIANDFGHIVLPPLA